MRVVTKEEFEQEKRTFLQLMKESVFVYPTDSIYGIGCDATNENLVARIRDLKQSMTQPFSVIVPNKEWVYEHCVVNEHARQWVDQLGSLMIIDGRPRAVSLILPLKNPRAIAPNVTQGKDTLSVRLPDHWFSDIVKELGVPIITTSANPTGGEFMTALENLHPRIRSGISFCVYEGEKIGSPSTLIHLYGDEIKIHAR